MMSVTSPMISKIKWTNFISSASSIESKFPISKSIKNNSSNSISISPQYLMSSNPHEESLLSINLTPWKTTRPSKAKNLALPNSSWPTLPKISSTKPKISPSKRQVPENKITAKFTQSQLICPKTPNLHELTNKNPKLSSKQPNKNNKNKSPKTSRKPSSIKMTTLKNTWKTGPKNN